MPNGLGLYPEFRREAVRLVEDGQSIAAAAQTPGVVSQTLFNSRPIAKVSHMNALRMAWFRRCLGKPSGLIFHSDRGSQYVSDNFRRLPKDKGITRSMSRCCNCWDNACSETLFGSLKVERLHGQRFETRRQANS